MTARLLVLLLRVGWLLLPFVAGPVLAAGTEERSRAVQLVAASGLWAVWAGVLVALLVPSTVSLTALRLAAPAVPAAALVASLADRGAASAAAEVLGIAAGVAVALLALHPVVGEVFVEGSSYGDERRRLLRPPGPLLLGPIEVAWAAVVAGPAVGALLLAARQWAAGTVVLVVAVPLAVVLVDRLHRLSRRWLVFVPAGLVLHDHLVLADTVLFRRGTIAGLAPAEAGTTATDCTGGAPGLALELRLHEPAPLLLAGTPRARAGRPVTTDRLLVCPSRPGSVMAEAARRGLPVGLR